MNRSDVTARQLFHAILGWFFRLTVSFILRRDPCLTIVIHRPMSSFADNSKYFFVYATALADRKDRIVMLTTDSGIRRSIMDAGGKAALHPTWRSILLMLRCGTVVTDNMDWYYFGAYQLTRGARIIQIWHGAPLKHIELDVYNKYLREISSPLRFWLKIQNAIVGRYPIYDLVVATSQWFIDQAFKSSFRARAFLATGYPRNDILFDWQRAEDPVRRLSLINVDISTMEMVAAERKKGLRVCLYAPTFRKDMDSPFREQISLERLSSFAKRINILVVLKLHPFMHGHNMAQGYSNLLEYAPLCDVYPLMTLTDLLITDYSSIFFDFLLLDRPIVFFPYDLNGYLSHDRDMYFEYEAMTPGAKCYTHNELEGEITRIINNDCQDGHMEFRQNIRAYTYDHPDNHSHLRICDHLGIF